MQEDSFEWHGATSAFYPLRRLGGDATIGTMIMGLSIVLVAALSGAQPAPDGAQAERGQLGRSAQVNEPPGPSKLILIRRFMELAGLQRRLDTGSFLDRHAFPGGPMWQSPAPESQPMDFFGQISARIDALHRAYERHRATYQQEYESHLNWEFTEAELREIVAFLERPVGQHYLDGSWRMEAYVGTNTEELEAQVVREASALLPQ